MIKYSIISPIHNEQECIRELISRIKKTMDKYAKGKWEYLLINDASTDNSRGLIESFAKNNRSIRLINHRKSMGQAGCFKTGFDNANGDVVVTLDGDLQVFPEDIPLFLDKLEKGYDIINGIREHRKHPYWIKIASRLYNVLMLIFFNSPVIDAASNFTAIKTRFVRNVRLKGNDHR